MVISNLLYDLNEHIQKKFWLYILSFLCLSIGIVIGIYSVKYMNELDYSDMKNYFGNLIQLFSKSDVTSKAILVQALQNNIPIILLIWFLGLTLIGIPIILLLDIFKGYTIGFTTSFMIKYTGIKGMGFSLLGIVPQNIIYIPCIILISVYAMDFSLFIIKEKISKQDVHGIWFKVGSYSFYFVLVLILMCVGFALETYLSPNMIKLLVLGLGSSLI